MGCSPNRLAIFRAFYLLFSSDPTLRFRRCRGDRDMIETFKIIRKIYDEETVPKLTPSSIE